MRRGLLEHGRSSDVVPSGANEARSMPLSGSSSRGRCSARSQAEPSRPRGWRSSSGAVRSALRAASACASRRNAGAIFSASAASAASSMVTSLPSRTTGRPPTSTVSTARPASENTICRAALLNGTKAGSLRSRIIRSAIMPGLSAPILPARPTARAPRQRRGLERVGGVDRMRLRIGHGGQQAQHPHGDEDVLRLGATVVVAAERDLDAGAMQIENRRDAALELQIADRIVHDTRALASAICAMSCAVSQTPCTTLRCSFIRPARASTSSSEGADGCCRAAAAWMRVS